jgi:hypothetical protein
MERINVEKACAGYNTARTANAGRKMSREQVITILKENGISGVLAKKMTQSSTLFTTYKRENCGRGKHLGYIWPTMPIHVNVFRNWLYPSQKDNAPKKDVSFEEECAEYLRKQGYLLKKCVGFDEDAFKKDYPQLYEKYLMYENI